MRTIKFRGISNGKWVYGYLLETPYNNYKYAIKDTPCNFNNGRFDLIPCEIQNDETIGQFTGLTDKNGVEIYEGDILKADTSAIGYVIFKYGSFIKKINNSVDISIASDVNVVIGNIFDNPELIK